MIRKMQLNVKFARGGGAYSEELEYTGESLQDIATAIEKDENELLYYMMTGDEKGSKAFVFQGFMFKKADIEAAQLREPDF